MANMSAFGSRIVARWPHHLVLDGLDTIELLLDKGNLLISYDCAGRRDVLMMENRGCQVFLTVWLREAIPRPGAICDRARNGVLP